MSVDTKVAALASAVQLKLSPEATVAAAKVFDAFLNGGEAPKAATAGKPATAGKKAAGKSEEEVVKAALEAQRAEAEAADAEGSEDAQADGGEETAEGGIPATKEGVAAGIAKLLKANLRKEAIGLLKKFAAASASQVKAKDYAKFVAEVEKLLPSEGGDDDLTA